MMVLSRISALSQAQLELERSPPRLSMLDGDFATPHELEGVLDSF